MSAYGTRDAFLCSKIRQPESIYIKVEKITRDQVVYGEKLKNFTGKVATLAVSKRGCLYLLSEVGGQKNHVHWFSV